LNLFCSGSGASLANKSVNAFKSGTFSATLPQTLETQGKTM